MDRTSIARPLMVAAGCVLVALGGCSAGGSGQQPADRADAYTHPTYHPGALEFGGYVQEGGSEPWQQSGAPQGGGHGQTGGGGGNGGHR
jgi:hypothetical protein